MTSPFDTNKPNIHSNVFPKSVKRTLPSLSDISASTPATNAVNFGKNQVSPDRALALPGLNAQNSFVANQLQQNANAATEAQSRIEASIAKFGAVYPQSAYEKDTLTAKNELLAFGASQKFADTFAPHVATHAVLNSIA